MTIPRTIFEVSARLSSESRSALVYEAYRCSHAAPVTLWLRGVTVDEIRPSLDVAVSRMGTGFAGVEFRLDSTPRELALEVSGAGARCITESSELVSLLDPRKTAVLNVRQVLSSSARRTDHCLCPSCLPLGEEAPDTALAIA